MEGMAPILHVANARASIEWYAKLGFQVESEHVFGPDWPLYVRLRRESDRRSVNRQPKPERRACHLRAGAGRPTGVLAATYGTRKRGLTCASQTQPGSSGMPQC